VYIEYSSNEFSASPRSAGRGRQAVAAASPQSFQTAKEPEKYRLEPYFERKFFTLFMDQEKDKNGIDLSRSLKESFPKFQDGQWSSGPYISPTAPKIIRWLIKYSGGIIRNEKQASYVLLGFIVFVVIISLFLIFNRGLGSKTLEPTGPAIEGAGSPRDIAPY